MSHGALQMQKMAISSLLSFHDLLFSGDKTSALKCFSDLDKCQIVQSYVVNLAKWPWKDLKTSLIPDNIAAKPLAYRNPVALKSTGNGNCLYNSVSLLLCGNESSRESLCILVAGELYFNFSCITKFFKVLH